MSKKPLIDSETEITIKKLAQKHRFNMADIRSNGTHQIEIYWNVNGQQQFIYINRNTGIKKSELQLVISPEMDNELAPLLYEQPSIFSLGRDTYKGKPIQSTQYKGFQNKLTKKGSHRGRAWRLPITDDLAYLNSFFQITSAIRN